MVKSLGIYPMFKLYSGLGGRLVKVFDLNLPVQITTREFSPGFVPYENTLSLTRIAGDKVCQLPAQGQWFSPPPVKLTAAI